MALFGIAEAVVGVVDNVLDKFVEDKDLRAKLNHELKTQVQKANLAQIAVNMEQAKHPSIFVAGARPAIMWICAFGLGWQFVFQPIFIWGLAVTAHAIPIPVIPTDGLLTLTLSLLGLGGMRSFEKMKGIQRENLK
tara:strand:- start:375 stop:782 length:408 start_codon:yes stop_codon:yes gene_type:complete